jgi:hypothetical protein
MIAVLLSVGSVLGGTLISTALRIYLGPVFETLTARTIGRIWRGPECDIRGTWSSTYDYPSRGAHKTAEQIMSFSQIGKNIHGKNVGGHGPHKHRITLRLDGHYLTGAWKNTAPGANHHGVLQLRLTADGSEMIGKWIGFDSGGIVQGGDWTMRRL